MSSFKFHLYTLEKFKLPTLSRLLKRVGITKFTMCFATNYGQHLTIEKNPDLNHSQNEY